jgi:hypothetical protein
MYQEHWFPQKRITPSNVLPIRKGLIRTQIRGSMPIIMMITDPDPAPDPYPTNGFQDAKKSKFVLTVFASYLL